jgi:hypothetical protein
MTTPAMINPQKTRKAGLLSVTSSSRSLRPTRDLR